MGYTTRFEGVLEFAHEPTVKELARLDGFLGADIREVEPGVDHDFYGIDLEVATGYRGLQWSGAEKTYGMCEVVNWLVAKMRGLGFKDFALTGELKAQGEDAADRWILRMVNGKATKVPNPPMGRKVSCPECDHSFYVED